MQKRNYQIELDKIIDRHQQAGERPRLLIHSCCAPCSSYVMEYLNRFFDLTMFFYNPNMDSAEEYDYRAGELIRLVEKMNENAGDDASLKTNIKVVVAAYDPENFENMAIGHENDPERGARCHLCYALRLQKTLEYMCAHNQAAGETGEACFDYFATTLTLSPLKDAEVLNRIGEQLAAQYEAQYLVSDFKKRNGYKRSIELSNEYGLYRQNYCGCRFSKNQSINSK